VIQVRSRTREPRGQVVIITAASMLVLMGIAALVVDLGFSWMLKRQEQNAADPAAIAAARHIKDPVTGDPIPGFAVQTEMNTDACFYAQANGFFDGDAGCAAALASGDLQVHSPPISGDYSARQGFVQVIISDGHPTFFARILGKAEVNVRSEAVAANTAGNSNTSSLVALQPVCAGGSAADVDGGGTVRIFPVNPGDVGGYVHVNSPCGSSTDDVCENGVGAAAMSISGVLQTPFAYTQGSCTYNGSGPNGLQCEPSTVTSCLDEDANPLGDPLAGLPEPNFADFPDGQCPDATFSTTASTKPCELSDKDCPPDTTDPTIAVCTLSPGVFYGGWDVKKKVHLELEPGMYILAGGGIKLTGADAAIEAVSSPTGVDARVTIFNTDGPGCPSIGAQCQGDITFTASQAFRAKALNAATCGVVTPQACPWRGILLWHDGSASNADGTIKMGGTASTILSGTIYAPLADVQISGGTSTTGCTAGPASGCLSIQIISYTWSITGGGLVEMPYDPSELYQLDQRGLVDERG
jgi:hypothetical protein